LYIFVTSNNIDIIIQASLSILASNVLILSTFELDMNEVLARTADIIDTIDTINIIGIIDIIGVDTFKCKHWL